MKMIIGFLVLSSSFAYARTYSSFHNYIYSIPVEIQDGNSLKNLLVEKGYNFDERDWLTITLHMNGIRKEELQSINSRTTIFLPPKKSLAEYNGSRNITSDNSHKKTCEPVSKNYLLNKYGQSNIAYLEYYSLVTSRKVQVYKGTSLYSVIAQDHFNYGSDARALKLIKEANGIRRDYVDSDIVINLPFCADSLESTRKTASVQTKRKVASVTRTQVIEKPLQTNSAEKEFKLKYSAGISAGAVGIESGSVKITSKLAKVNVKARHEINKDYSAGAGIALTQFYSITHSESNETKSASTTYPEFGFDVTRNMDGWKVALAYDSLNYLLATTSLTNVNLDPILLHRLSLKPFYSVTDQVGIFGGVGYLKSFGSESLTGYDVTAGTSYLFGRLLEYNLSALMNMNSLNTSLASENDRSQSWILSLNKTF